MRHWIDFLIHDKRHLELRGEELAQQYRELMQAERQAQAARERIEEMERQAVALIRQYSLGKEMKHAKLTWLKHEFQPLRNVYNRGQWLEKMHKMCAEGPPSGDGSGCDDSSTMPKPLKILAKK